MPGIREALKEQLWDESRNYTVIEKKRVPLFERIKTVTENNSDTYIQEEENRLFSCFLFSPISGLSQKP